MKKWTIYTTTLLGICCQLSYAQRTKKFKLELPEQKAAHSLYQHFSFIDSRADTTNMGFVQTGMLNARAQVVAEPALQEQLTTVFHALTDSADSNRELVFQLRNLRFSELTSAFSERGDCAFRAALLSRQNDQYFPIASIDTVISFKSIEVTKGLYKRAGQVLTDFISGHLAKTPDTILYSLADVMNVDSTEKRSLKVYGAATYEEGIYRTYSAFADQVPDGQGTINKRKERSDCIGQHQNC